MPNFPSDNFKTPQSLGNSFNSLHSQNSDFLKNAGLNNYQRYNVYQAINDWFDKNPALDGNKREGTFDAGDYTLGVEGWWEDTYDDDNELTNSEFKYKINRLDNYQQQMKDLLKSKNIVYEQSNQSPSLYFTHNGSKYRLSNHKRPLQEGYYDPSNQYDEDIIEPDNYKRFQKLKSLLDEKQDK